MKTKNLFFLLSTLTMLALLRLYAYALDNIFDLKTVFDDEDFSSVVLIVVVLTGIVLPHFATTCIMSDKGYSKREWFFLSFFLSWLGVIIALCMTDVKRQEQRHYEAPQSQINANERTESLETTLKYLVVAFLEITFLSLFLSLLAANMIF
jgi:hypothetical protein